MLLHRLCDFRLSLSHCQFTCGCIAMMSQDFEVDLEGAQTLRILCYKQEHESSTLIGKGAFEVRHH